MNKIIIYLIRHAETFDENGIRNTSENSQLINEKEILSVKGEEQAKKLSENEELKNLDSIWSSSYTRAKATAKYIANVNNLPFRTSDGESAEQTRERMNRFFDKILKEYKGKKIAVISHGGSIKFSC